MQINIIVLHIVNPGKQEFSHSWHFGNTFRLCDYTISGHFSYSPN